MIGDPFKARFSGHYQIEKKLSQVNYLVKMPETKKLYPVCHVNMLKTYYVRDREPEKQVLVTARQSEESNPDDLDFDVPQSKLSNEEVLSEWDRIVSYLSQEQGTELKGLLQQYEDICRNRMRRTNNIVHEVEVGNVTPLEHHYRLNLLKGAQVRKEVEAMLQEDIIEPSQ
eukprot:g27772.t1